MPALRVRELYRQTSLALLAVESVTLSSHRTKSGCRLFGRIEPVAVVVCGPERSYAIDMDAVETDLGRLRRLVPGLDAAIADPAD